MSVSWKEFQDVVARIEQGLAPKGAVVKSPDRIKDLVTGRLREVDASIRFTVGSAPVLITVECRKRSRIQDDTWIEQLATKRGKIGATTTIAVVPSGFSSSAVASARALGIQLRSLKELTGESIEALAKSLEVSSIELNWSNVGLAFVYKTEHPQPIPSTLGVCTNDTPVLVHLHDQRAVTLKQLTNAVVSNLTKEDGTPWNIVEDLIADGPAVRLSTNVRLPPGEWSSPTMYGLLEVSSVTVTADFRRIHRPLSITYAADYVAPDGKIVRWTERTIPLSAKEKLIVVSMNDMRQTPAR